MKAPGSRHGGQDRHGTARAPGKPMTAPAGGPQGPDRWAVQVGPDTGSGHRPLLGAGSVLQGVAGRRVCELAQFRNFSGEALR